MALTDTACRTAKAGEKPYRLSDGGGLQLWVHTSGSKTWRLAYRWEGKQKFLTFGTYPSLSLAEARGMREDAKRLLRSGVDPRSVEKAEEEGDHKFRPIALAWFENAKSKWRENYRGRAEARLHRDVLPLLGDKNFKTIESTHILDAIRAVEDRGALYTARRVKQMVVSIFKYGKAHGIRADNPATDLDDALKPRKKPKHRASIPERDLPKFFEALSQYEGEFETRLALLLTIQTLTRTKEIRFAQWREFEDLDGANPLWRIPPERMKMDREHLVPLAPQTVRLLKRIRQFSGQDGYLFPSGGKKGVMSENTMLYALYRMGYHSRATVHGFRTTASTMLNEHGWNGDWVERQLSHDEDDEVRAAYNAAEYLSGRRDMLKWYCDKLDGLGAAKII